MVDKPKVEKIGDSTHWKDRAAGWCKWRITFKQCVGCKRPNAVLTLMGQRTDVDRLLENPEQHTCNRCS